MICRDDPGLRFFCGPWRAPAGPELRIRLSSLEPLELDPALLRWLAGEPVFCPHLHIPLQSGSDGVLARMKRPYDAALFRSRVALARSLWPKLGLGTDVIVGFPGETEAEFAETYDLLNALPFSYLHVFPYSPRPGTPAAELPERVAPPRIKARKLALMELGRQKREAHARSLLGQTGTVLLEGAAAARPGFRPGFSETYAACEVAAATTAPHGLVAVRFTEYDPARGVLLAVASDAAEGTP